MSVFYSMQLIVSRVCVILHIVDDYSCCYEYSTISGIMDHIMDDVLAMYYIYGIGDS